MITAPLPPHAALSQRLDAATVAILDRLRVVAHLMRESETDLLTADADTINATMQTQGVAMGAKLEAFATLGGAINQVFAMAGEAEPLDTRTFAEKLASNGKQLTAEGVQPLPEEAQQ